MDEYHISDQARYGPTWRNRLPPGLPTWARGAGQSGSAIGFIARKCGEARHSEHLYHTLLALAYNESKLRVGLPAGLFNNTSNGRVKITAWGCFQWNVGAQARLRPFGAPTKPWGDGPASTVREEIDMPLMYYAGVYQQALEMSLPVDYCALVVRLHHYGPGYLRTFVRRVRGGMNPAAAAQNISANIISPRTGERYTRTVHGDEVISKHRNQVHTVRTRWRV